MSLPGGRAPLSGPDAYSLREQLFYLRKKTGELDSVLARGRLVEDVSLSPFTDNVINHSLGRTLRGYLVVRRQAVLSAFHAYRNAAGTQPTGSATVALDTELYDDASAYNLGSNFYTAPVDGLYQFEFGLQLTGAADGDRNIIQLRKNGSTLVGKGSMQANGGATALLSFGSAAIRLLAGDTVEPWAFVSNAGGLAYSVGGPLNGSFLRGGLIDEGVTDRQAANPTPEKTLLLRASYAHTVSLWVF